MTLADLLAQNHALVQQWAGGPFPYASGTGFPFRSPQGGWMMNPTIPPATPSQTVPPAPVPPVAKKPSYPSYLPGPINPMSPIPAQSDLWALGSGWWTPQGMMYPVSTAGMGAR